MQMWECFFDDLGSCKKMVLSTSLDDKVTSRMMSMIIINREFYFQTDINFRKYEQIKYNPNVSLCADNIQIEGLCKETGQPSENPIFCSLYQKYFTSSYNRYTNLSNERLFVIKPTSIRKWIYENNIPMMESYDFSKKHYSKNRYFG